MSGFWEGAFSNLGANAELVWDAALDASDNLNPLSPQFMSGEAKHTATDVEKQVAARTGREPDPVRIDNSSKGGLVRIVQGVRNTGTDVGKQASVALDAGAKAAGGALDLLTNKWVIGGAVGVVLLVLLAPYIAPVVAKVVST